MLDAMVLAFFTEAAYFALTWAGNAYSRKTHWQPPAGSPDSDNHQRRRVIFNLGVLAVLVGAITCARWITAWPGRLLTGAEIALLAASGTSDLRRFQLPLPFTVLGMVIALMAMFLSGLPSFILLFALAWAFVVVVAHALVTRGSMQLGDHIATFWVALAAPFNGLIAIAAGDMADVVFAHLKDLRGKKVAAAGAWLVCAAALAGLPPYIAWFTHAQPVASRDAGVPGSGAPGVPASLPVTAQANIAFTVTVTVTPTVTYHQVAVARELITLSEWASDHTGRIGLLPSHTGRVWQAQKVAVEVARFAEAAQQIAPRAVTTSALKDLVQALQNYNVALVRDACERLAHQRELLAPIAAEQPALLEEASDLRVDQVQPKQ